jgi:glycosyltransferase involved in cell wall biosynthesis
MGNIKAIFLTHKGSLYSEITGGVQLCSQEFRYIIQHAAEISLEDYYVPYTRNLLQRVLIRCGLENYSVFNIRKEAPALLSHIARENIRIVFINMATLLRFARPIKQKFGDQVKIVLLSHGNHSGDFLHLITKPVGRPSLLKRWLNRNRLGRLIATEAEYRVKWLDGVVALSETERQIENWFGAKRASFLPRRLYKDFLPREPVPGRIGFVGRLDHPPNFQGVTILLEELAKQPHELSFRLAGAPPEYGMKIRQRFPFVEYLGELTDQHLEQEVATWAFFLNPVWWYSTGASTKLARAISWGLPIISTTAGMRGYEWGKGSLLIADSPAEMVKQLLTEAGSPERINYWKEQTELIAENGPDQNDLMNRIRYAYA